MNKAKPASKSSAKESLAKENEELKDALKEKDVIIADLKNQLNVALNPKERKQTPQGTM